MLKAGVSLRRSRVLWRTGMCAVAVVWCALVGCMTPEKAYRESNETGVRLATEAWQQQTGSTNEFDFNRPADALTLRIALLAVARGEQGVIFPKIPHADKLAVSNDMLTLSLADAMCVAARNDRTYQNYKEAVFTAALDLDYQQYQFDTTFSGMMLALLSGDMPPDKASGSGSAGFARKLESGATFAGNLAVDVVSLLRDDWRSFGLSGDLSMTMPLMRGAGRDIVREPLTQAERNLVYAIQNFERYRQTYAISVAQSYFSVVQNAQVVRNELDNEMRLKENSRKADMMFEAGQMTRIEVDQASTDLLNANKSVIDSRQRYEQSLDSLKMMIGLPPEAKIGVDLEEVERLDRKMQAWAAASEDAVAAFPDEAESCRIALAERRDLFVTRWRVEDEERAVKIAADALRADMTLTGGTQFDRARATGDGKFDGNEMWDAGLRVSMPWNRRRERNAFRKQLIALEQAKRGLEQQEDSIKQAVRTGRRDLIAARASYVNQVETLKVTTLRVASISLSMQAGRAEMRDVLDAQRSLLSARNMLCSIMIAWQMSELQLRCDMGVLMVSDSGMWVEANEADNG